MNEDPPEFVPYIPGDGKDEPDTPPRLDMTVALVLCLEVLGERRANDKNEHGQYQMFSLRDKEQDSVGQVRCNRKMRQVLGLA